MSQVAASVMTGAGIAVDYQAMDWGSVTQRRTSKAPADPGGWSAFFTAAAGLEMFDPIGHNQSAATAPTPGSGGLPAPSWNGCATCPRSRSASFCNRPATATPCRASGESGERESLCEEARKVIVIPGGSLPPGAKGVLV